MRYRKRKINGRTVSEHRLVVEQALGAIPAGHVVHHRNEDRLDNRLSNLEVMTHAEHCQHHNQKHPITKQCVVCSAEFTPHPTKRERAKTCSEPCRRISQTANATGGTCSSCGAIDHRAPTCPIVLGVDPDELRAAVARGDSLRAIGRRVGIHHSQVKVLLTALGIAFSLGGTPVWVAPERRPL